MRALQKTVSATPACLMLVLVSVCVGCGADYGRLEPQPVFGQVVINGQPAVGCTVVFVPVDPEVKGKVMPGGKTKENGMFQLTSHETGDGAPVGEYGVTLSWEATTWPDMEAEMARDRDAVKPVGPDRLNQRFSSPEKSGIMITVKPGEEVLAPIILDDVEFLKGTEPEVSK